MIIIESPRLHLKQFQIADAEDVFSCISPIVTKYMPWEQPSWDEYRARCEIRTQYPDPEKFHFVIRRRDNTECLGMSSLEDASAKSPELGLWLKASAHGQGFGKEVVTAIAKWGMQHSGKNSFIYPVAVQNTASRRIAESLHGEIIEHRSGKKYESVVYKIPWENDAAD